MVLAEHGLNNNGVRHRLVSRVGDFQQLIVCDLLQTYCGTDPLQLSRVSFYPYFFSSPASPHFSLLPYLFLVVDLIIFPLVVNLL